MAYQAGCLPIRAESIEWALELNGVAVERNRAAFRWGRAQIAAPEAVAQATQPRTRAPIAAEPRLSAALGARCSRLAQSDAALEGRLRRLTADLVAYQNEGLARRFHDVLARVMDRESAVTPGSTTLLAAAADGLHKLLAYKDEYEVARLMLDPEAMAPAKALAGPDSRTSWMLHPPLLRDHGLTRKLAIPLGAAPLMRRLAKAKGLRGTPFDPFGRTRLRELERALPGEYEQALDRVLAALKPQNHDDAVRAARLPLEIRGFEGLKLARINEFRTRLDDALARIERG